MPSSPPPPFPSPSSDEPLPKGMTTAEILAACRRGDRRAEETLFRQYFSRLISLVRRRLSRRLTRRVDPEDVVLSAYRSFFVRLREGSGFSATETPEDLWALLATITRRKIAKQARRHHAQRRAVGQEVPEGSADAIDPGEPAEAAAILADEVEQLLAALGKTDREILVRLLEGATSTEIAKERGCSERTVRRARERIDQAIASRQNFGASATQPIGTPSTQRNSPSKSAGRSAASGLTPSHRETDFLLQQLCGEGSFAKVYRALDRKSGETVAVKFLRKEQWSDPRAVAALLREYELLRMLRHPGIVTVHGWGMTPAGATFLVLEWVDGENLVNWPRENHSLAETLAAANQIAEALAAAHQQGILHGDLSPANVLRRREGRILLSDFGFARWSESPDDPILRGGTPGFLPPEALSDQTATNTPWTDMYGFAALLTVLLIGTLPVAERDQLGTAAPGVTETSHRSLRERGVRISPELDELIVQALASDPRDRPAGLGLFLHVLRRELAAEAL